MLICRPPEKFILHWFYSRSLVVFESSRVVLINANMKTVLSATPEDEADKSLPQNVDVNFNRNKKDRKSGRKNRRRNSEPIGKHLQRGQKQVKGECLTVSCSCLKMKLEVAAFIGMY